MSTYARNPGEIYGHHWYFPSIRKSGEFPHVMIDTNNGKSFVHARLAAAAGDRGAMTLSGGKKTDHRAGRASSVPAHDPNSRRILTQ